MPAPERKEVPEVIDSSVTAEILVNEWLVHQVIISGGVLEKVNEAIGLKLQILGDEEKGLKLVEEDLWQYFDGGMMVLQLPGFKIKYDAGAVRNYLIQSLSLFKSLKETDQKLWMKDIDDGQRLSTASFPLR